MNRRADKTLTRWLHNEQAGEQSAAEQAFARLMVSLPRENVSSGFADRVLAASGLSLLPIRERRLQPWAWRLAFGVCLVASFLAASGAAGFLGDLMRSGQLVSLGSRLVVAMSRFGAECLLAVNGLFRAGGAVSAAFSGPATLALVFVCAVSSLIAARVLISLVVPDRSIRHA